MFNSRTVQNNSIFALSVWPLRADGIHTLPTVRPTSAPADRLPGYAEPNTIPDTPDTPDGSRFCHPTCRATRTNAVYGRHDGCRDVERCIGECRG